MSKTLIVIAAIIGIIVGLDWIVESTHHRVPTMVKPVVQVVPPEPFTCAVIGDSIADMVQDFLPECDHNTKIGISSAAVLARVLAEKPRSVIVVSAGSNDPTNPRLAANLAAIRAHNPIIWIVPSATAGGGIANARRAVMTLAAAHQDPMVQFVPGCCGVQAKVHPKFPAQIAADVRKLPIWRGKK